MKNNDFENLCIKLVKDYANEHLDKSDNVVVEEKNVFVVWICKTLQNNKALLSTTLLDGMYYEITYNGDKKEIYAATTQTYFRVSFAEIQKAAKQRNIAVSS